MTPPTVVNLKNAECDVYIGRTWSGRAIGPGRIRHLPGSLWGNPFTIAAVQRAAHPKTLTPAQARAECIRQYEGLMRKRLRLQLNGQFWRGQLRGLAGKRLGCWCAPKPCHGDVLVKLWVELFGGEDVRETR